MPTPTRRIIRRALPTQAAGIACALAALAAAGCQRDDRVVKYKPFFTNVAGAEFRGEQAAPVNPNEGYLDPTALPSDAKLVIENPDGSKVLIAKSVRHMMSHLERFLDEGEDDLLLEQVISEKTREHYASKGQDPRQILRYLRRNRKEVARLFARLPMGEYTPTAILEQPGDKTWVVKLTGAPASDLKFTRVWARLEDGNWRFVWID